jgi:hypothetical protein
MKPHIRDSWGKNFGSRNLGKDIFATHVGSGIDFNNDGNVRGGKCKIIEGSNLGGASNFKESGRKVPGSNNRIGSVGS